jgi:hypothetical protein
MEADPKPDQQHKHKAQKTTSPWPPTLPSQVNLSLPKRPWEQIHSEKCPKEKNQVGASKAGSKCNCLENYRSTHDGAKPSECVARYPPEATVTQQLARPEEKTVGQSSLAAPRVFPTRSPEQGQSEHRTAAATGD